MTIIIGKVSEIDLKIKALQEKKKQLEERNLHDLAKVIKKLGADSLPLDILVGSLLETVEAFQQKKDIIKNWQTKGKDFLEADKRATIGGLHLIPFESLNKTQHELLKLTRKVYKLQYQFSRQMNQQRAARTRTLLQLGGLLIRSGIIEKLGITIGADLQKDEHQKKKAYTLLGILITQLSVPTEIEKIKETERLGKQFLSQAHNNEIEENLKAVIDNSIAL